MISEICKSCLKISLALVLGIHASLCSAQAIFCDKATYDTFRAIYPLLTKCAKLTNIDSHSIYVLARLQGGAVFRFEPSSEFTDRLDNAIVADVTANNKRLWRSANPNLDLKALLGSPDMQVRAWLQTNGLPKFQIYSGGLDFDFDILNGLAGRSGLAKALTEQSDIGFRFGSIDRSVKIFNFDISKSKHVFLETLGLNEIHQNGVLQNLEDYYPLPEFASKSCEESAGKTPYWKCMEPVNQCIFNSQKNAARLKECLDSLPR